MNKNFPGLFFSSLDKILCLFLLRGRQIGKKVSGDEFNGMRDEVRVVHGISSSFLEHKCCPKKYNIIANYIPVSITNYTRTGSMVNSLPRIKEDLCMKIKEKHKRMAYTAFWTKAPPGRKKNIPKGTASNG